MLSRTLGALRSLQVNMVTRSTMDCVGRRFSSFVATKPAGWTDADELATQDLAHKVSSSDRRSMSQAITLMESTLLRDRYKAERLLQILHGEKKKTGEKEKILVRIGISGPPGVGKSSLIEEIGCRYIERNHRVGVLAIDPSSHRTGGSILGDKTRMQRLSVMDEAYIRPSPSRGHLGGVARGTYGAVKVLESSNFDVVLVETVGVGQSEIEVESFVDFFLLLLPPGGGDELQGMKKGVVEVADGIVVTKADGDLLNSANQARNEYARALTLLSPKHHSWIPPVMTCSSVTLNGVDDIISMIDNFVTTMTENGELQRKREEQAVLWMWKTLQADLTQRIENDLVVKTELPNLEAKVRSGLILPSMASERIMDLFLHQHKPL